MPLLKLRNEKLTPPGYWRVDKLFRTPSPGLASDYIYGGDLADLVKKVTEYRIANGLLLGDIDAQVQDWLCRNTEAQCRAANPANKVQSRKAKGVDVARFLMAMAAWMKSDECVPQEEAERRASICSGCKFNVAIDDQACLGCFGLASRVLQVIGDRHTKFDSTLAHCAVCGCHTGVSAFVPMSILAKVHETEEFPDDTGQVEPDGTPTRCWKREWIDANKANAS